MAVSRHNILAFVKKHFPEHRIGSSGTEANVNCCYHADNKRHMYINLDKGIFNCFSCQKKGSFFDLAKILSPRQQFQQAKNIEESFADLLKEQDTKIFLPAETEYFYSLNRYSKVAFNYLIRRGLSESDIYYYKIGYCAFGKYSGRVIIPILDRDDNPIAFIARDYTGVMSPKVLTPAAPKGTSGVKDFVFNLYRAYSTKKLIITEGVFDSIAAGVSGIAILGKVPTSRQLALICHAKPFEVVIALDPDAEKEAYQLAEILTGFQHSNRPNVSIAKFPVGEDASSIGKERTSQIIKEAVEYSKGLDYAFDF